VESSLQMEPFTETLPLRISSSQERREPSPAAARKRFRRNPADPGVRLSVDGS
jgi:hypothetical protein